MSVMIGTKVKDGETWLPRFISQVENLDGDILKIVAMYGKSRDRSFALLDHWRNTSKHDVEIYADPYLHPPERHGAFLAKVKRDLQTILKESGAQYFLNLDCDLVRLPPSLIPRLMRHDKDIIASMIWTENRSPPTFFDTYVFRLDGCKFHPYNPPGMNASEPIAVDSVSTCYLAKSEVELAGTYRNPHPHIGFGQSLRDQGYQVWIDPTTHVAHIDLEKLGITRDILPIPMSFAPYIDAKGVKYNPEQIGATMYHVMRTQYDIHLLQTEPEVIEPAYQFLRNRPLITASYKVHPHEYEILPYSIGSIYPYVDLIDIITGPIELREDTYPQSLFRAGGIPAKELDLEDPDGKIRIIYKTWRDKQEIQHKLLEICRSKWMLFIDGDEIIHGMDKLRAFCEEHPDGTKDYARPERFLNFWHDFHNVAYSLNPISPWAQFGVPHAFLIHRDIAGLNFGMFHTIPTDGFGLPVHSDEGDREKKEVLDGVQVFHLGNAKDSKAMRDKLTFEKNRGIGYEREVKDDPWFTGKLPPDMVIQEYDGDYPDILKSHPRFGKRTVKVTRTKPHYEFEVMR